MQGWPECTRYFWAMWLCLLTLHGMCARQMAQYYELVVYTDQLPTYADPILDRLDPQRFIQYRLYRDSTQYVNGKHVRGFMPLPVTLGYVTTKSIIW